MSPGRPIGGDAGFGSTTGHWSSGLRNALADIQLPNAVVIHQQHDLASGYYPITVSMALQTESPWEGILP